MEYPLSFLKHDFHFMYEIDAVLIRILEEK